MLEIDRGVALAGAGILGLFEALVLITALFLVTRAWGIVAPNRGRWLGRLTLIAGIPSLLFLAVAGRTVVPEGWEAVFESAGLTAVTVSLLLAGVWGVALLVRLSRWLIRRPADRSRDRGLLREFAALSSCTVAIVGVVVLVQWQLHYEELKEERRTHEELQTRLRALQVTESRVDEFEQEKRNVQERVATMRRILPERLDVELFMDRYADECQKHAVRLESWAGEQDTSGRVHRAVIHARLEGEPDAVTALGDRTGKLPRLTYWQPLSVEGSSHLVMLTVLAMPTQPGRAGKDLCANEPSQVFLWPLKARVQAARGL